MYTLKVTLKQHTPLIHFQHDQEGATLRASEVKPKLDKYILAQLGNGKFEQGKSIAKDKGWLVGKGNHAALDYKIRINAMGFQDVTIPIKLVRKNGEVQMDEIGRQLYVTNNYPDNNTSLIMSNIGGKAKDEIFNLSMANSIELIFYVKEKGLLDKLKDELCLFFAKTSFGNRTSKGFGSFEVISINDSKDEGLLDSDSYILSFTMSLGNELKKDIVYKDVFKIIQSIWKTLKKRSGVKGKAERNVLLNISPQNTKGAERIPSPIRFKPLIDFYKENGSYFCDVSIATFFNNDVIKHVSENINTLFYADKIRNLLKNEESNLYYFLNNITESKIVKQSVNIELL